MLSIDLTKINQALNTYKQIRKVYGLNKFPTVSSTYKFDKKVIRNIINEAKNNAKDNSLESVQSCCQKYNLKDKDCNDERKKDGNE